MANMQSETTEVSSAADDDQATVAKESHVFPFLRLPPELRNLVYEKVAEDQILYLRRRKVIGRSTLIGVSRQIREEYSFLFPFGAKAIHIKVNSFNFAEVVGFINRLSTTQLDEATTISGVKREPVAIIIVLYQLDMHVGRSAPLERWLYRFDDPAKRGATLNSQYIFARDCPVDIWKIAETCEVILNQWIGIIHQYERENQGARSEQEAVKMRRAVQAASDAEAAKRTQAALENQASLEDRANAEALGADEDLGA